MITLVNLTNFLKSLKVRIHVTVLAFRSFSPTPFQLRKLLMEIPKFFFLTQYNNKDSKAGKKNQRLSICTVVQKSHDVNKQFCYFFPGPVKPINSNFSLYLYNPLCYEMWTDWEQQYIGCVCFLSFAVCEEPILHTMVHSVW